ncbi:hypothetical protein CXF86_10535 [Shewanella sp. GutCb]|nr:hypothetical protein CXF86_10535 [Shewanella sp. GutCb]
MLLKLYFKGLVMLQHRLIRNTKRLQSVEQQFKINLLINMRMLKALGHLSPYAFITNKRVSLTAEI